VFTRLFLVYTKPVENTAMPDFFYLTICVEIGFIPIFLAVLAEKKSVFSAYSHNIYVCLAVF
jgi:hypothetical protein